jgi:hypothetical protein
VSLSLGVWKSQCLLLLLSVYIVFVYIKFLLLFVLYVLFILFNFLYHAIERITVHSIADTGLHSNALTFVQAQGPNTHTHCTGAYHTLCTVLLECTCLDPSRDLFFRSFSSFPISLPLCTVQPSPSSSPFFSHTPHTSTPNHRKPPPLHLRLPTGLHHRHCAASAGPPFTPISPFFFSITQLQLHPNFSFCPHF